MDGAAHIFANRARENFIMLLGMPKVGKSWLLRKLALISALNALRDSSEPAPLLVNLQKLPLSSL